MTNGRGNPNVAELFVRAAVSRADAPAIVGPAGETYWSFGALAEVGSRIAGALAGLGVGPGDRVLVLETDPRRRYAAVAGVLWAGATLLIPPGSAAAWQAMTIAATTAPSLVIFGPELWPIVATHRGLRQVPRRATIAGPRLPGTVVLDSLGTSTIDPVHVPEEAPALASFTTGSTGRPALILRSHAVLHAQHRALRRLRGLSPEDRDLVGLPLLVLHNLGSGVTSVVPPSASLWPGRGRPILETIALARPTSAVGFPSLFEAAAAGRAGPDDGLRRLRTIHVGGSRVTTDLLAMLRRLAPAARVEVVYGSTEVEPIASIAATEYLDALAAADPTMGVPVGRVEDGLELQVDPIPGITIGAPRLPVGSLRVRGPHAAAEVAGDWLALGDLGWIDAEQRLWLLGRAANAVGGLLPFPVELAVEHLPGVRRAALVRLDRGGEPGALVAAEPLLDSAASRRACFRAVEALGRQRHWPIAVLKVGRLPVVRGPSGKVDAPRLARAAAPRWRISGLTTVRQATEPSAPSRSGHR